MPTFIRYSYFYSNVTENVPFDNSSALWQIMARLRTGDKPLSEQMVVYFTVVYVGLIELNKRPKLRVANDRTD